MYLTTAWLRPDSGRQRLWIGGRRERSTLWLTWLCLVRERATTGGFMDQRPQRRSGRLRVGDGSQLHGVHRCANDNIRFAL